MRWLNPLLVALPLAAAAQPVPADIETDALAADQRASQLRRDADLADAKARQARAQAILYARQIQAGEARAIRIEQRKALLEAAMRRQRERLAEQQGEIARLLAALQTLSRRPTSLVLLEPQSALQTARVSALLAAVRPVLAERTKGLTTDLARKRGLAAKLADAERQLAAVEVLLAANVRALDAVQRRARAARDRLDAEADAERARARELASRAIDLRGLTSAIERDGRRSAGAAPRGSLVEAGGDGPYAMPASGRIVARFGTRTGAGVRSRGLTIGTRPQAQVTAPAAGRIAYAGPFREYGDIVIIEHVGERLSLLSGMERVDGVVGETVAAGTPVGRMGSDQPRLYIELRVAGRPVDPERSFGRRG
jgi:murein hydrolase activator